MTRVWVLVRVLVIRRASGRQPLSDHRALRDRARRPHSGPPPSETLHFNRTPVIATKLISTASSNRVRKQPLRGRRFVRAVDAVQRPAQVSLGEPDPAVVRTLGPSA